MTPNLTIIYGLLTVLSFIFAAAYARLVHKKEKWLLLVHGSVAVINAGYFFITVSRTVEAALCANRIAYFGSVFLPVFMFLLIMKLCRCSCGQWMRRVLFLLGTAVFLLTASGGYCPLYYREVSLRTINGCSKLVKVYGPFHALYGIYLLFYFLLMVGVILYAAKRKRTSWRQAAFLAAAVLGNLAIWYLEQLIETDFEFLSVSYVFTELLLVLLYSILEEIQKQREIVSSGLEQEKAAKEATSTAEVKSEREVQEETESETEMAAAAEIRSGTETIAADPETAEKTIENAIEDTAEKPAEITEKEDRKAERKAGPEIRGQIFCRIPEAAALTAREQEVLQLIVEKRKRKEIAELLGVSENTIKKHTSHIFAKIQVTNRRELFERLAGKAEKKTGV